MGKISAFLSICLAFTGAMRLLFPGETAEFVSIDWIVAVLCLAVAALTYYNAYGRLARANLSEIWAFMGLALGALFLTMLYTPTLGSIRQSYVSASDILLVGESAVVCGLAYTRRKPDAVTLSTYMSVAWLFIMSSLRWKSLSFPSQQQTYRQKHAH